MTWNPDPSSKAIPGEVLGKVYARPCTTARASRTSYLLDPPTTFLIPVSQRGMDKPSRYAHQRGEAVSLLEITAESEATVSLVGRISVVGPLDLGPRRP
jgi:hypothetical protein